MNGDGGIPRILFLYLLYGVFSIKNISIKMLLVDGEGKMVKVEIYFFPQICAV